MPLPQKPKSDMSSKLEARCKPEFFDACRRIWEARGMKMGELVREWCELGEGLYGGWADIAKELDRRKKKSPRMSVPAEIQRLVEIGIEEEKRKRSSKEH